MNLTIDIGNTQTTLGVFNNDKLIAKFSFQTNASKTQDEYGLLIKSLLQENQIDVASIERIGVCSVVPPLDSIIDTACQKYIDAPTLFLKAGIKTGLKIRYNNPYEVGADRIADAIAATNLYPEKNLIIADLGTATVFCAINKKKEYLGGAIMPGLNLSMDALSSRTAKLSCVNILQPENPIGKSTVESIQSGLYYSHLGAIKELFQRFSQSAFSDEKPLFIATGGLAQMFKDENTFDSIHDDLVLHGMRHILEINE